MWVYPLTSPCHRKIPFVLLMCIVVFTRELFWMRLHLLCLPVYNLSADPAYSVNSSKPAAPTLLLYYYLLKLQGWKLLGTLQILFGEHVAEVVDPTLQIVATISEIARCLYRWMFLTKIDRQLMQQMSSAN